MGDFTIEQSCKKRIEKQALLVSCLARVIERLYTSVCLRYTVLLFVHYLSVLLSEMKCRVLTRTRLRLAAAVLNRAVPCRVLKASPEAGKHLFRLAPGRRRAAPRLALARRSLPATALNHRAHLRTRGPVFQGTRTWGQTRFVRTFQARTLARREDRRGRTSRREEDRAGKDLLGDLRAGKDLLEDMSKDLHALLYPCMLRLVLRSRRRRCAPV
jgi:hypothetical protein